MSHAGITKYDIDLLYDAKSAYLTFTCDTSHSATNFMTKK